MPMKSSYFPFQIGDITCAAVSAGEGRFNVSAFFANAPADELQSLLTRYGIKGAKIATPFNCLLIRHRDALVLIDTGTKAAKLVANLRAAGIAPEDSDLLILSHAHPDHIHGALIDGVRVVAVPGHTPGQIGVKVESQGETLLYTADVIAHPIHLERSDWNIVSDADRALVLQTRAAVLAQAAEAGWWLFVYHFPFPGLCRIAREGDHWRITERRAALIE